ncbi:hypothetical protein GCM10007424_28260 [Flavobacterium suaedae]|uniref:Glycosyltransferase RgtA/B/C/D-like domain-containing protein n=1 Tax=Flavobacterium suaedae TaxID=1767027 RepID=A0ABQ1K4Q8_9FLAO|nr:hypothetical protein [Flavobacterium suaedae]GGB86529.1 hypothetical protein GCM10007424_28260 [Flavobacterium suaedae]
MTFKNISNYISERPITTIILFGIIVRLLLLSFYCHVTIFPDSDDYIHASQQILKMDLSDYNGVRTLGYPAFISLTNSHLPLTIFLQFVIGIITSVYVYKIMLLLNFRKGIALPVTLLLSSFIHSLFYETNILTETLTLLFVTLVFYNLCKIFFHDSKSWKQFLILGLLLGYLAFIKPFYMFLPLLIYGLYTITNFKIGRIIDRMAIIFVFPILAFLASSYINYQNTGRFVCTTIYGVYASQICTYFAEKAPDEYSETRELYIKCREEIVENDGDIAMTGWRVRYKMEEQTGLNLIEISEKLNEFSKATVKENPIEYGKQVLRAWLGFWGTNIYWNYDDFNFKYTNKVFLSIWYIESAILKILKLLFVLIIPYHIFLYIKNRKTTPEFIIVMIVFAASVAQAMSTFGENSRFIFPFESILIISLLLTFKPLIERIIKQPLLKT